MSFSGCTVCCLFGNEHYEALVHSDNYVCVELYTCISSIYLPTLYCWADHLCREVGCSFIETSINRHFAYFALYGSRYYYRMLFIKDLADFISTNTYSTYQMFIQLL